MSKYFIDALQIEDPSFVFKIRELEKKFNHPNLDIKLHSEIATKLAVKINELGLDPSDTTNPELIEGLKQKLINDDTKLLKDVRFKAAKYINAEANVDQGIAKVLNDELAGTKVFAIKNAVIKRYIINHPPKKLMKRLGYRSADSLIKRINPTIILIGINYLESETYIKDFYHNYIKLTPQDFEERNLQIIYSPTKLWRELLSEIVQKKKLTCLSSYELASLVILPISNQPKPGEISSGIILGIEEVNKIKSVSWYLKLNQFNKKFSHLIYDIAEKEPILDVNVLGNKLALNQAHSLLSKITDYIELEYIDKSDLAISNLEEVLTNISKEYGFWKDSSYLAKVDNKSVASLNILDVAKNVIHDLKNEHSSTEHFKKSLTNELITRYVDKNDVANALNIKLTLSPALAE